MAVVFLLSFVLFVISVPALLFARSRRWAKWTVVFSLLGCFGSAQFIEPSSTHRQTTVAASSQPAKPSIQPQTVASPTTPRDEIDFHCLSSWDGSLTDLVYEVKQSLREPDSFEHIDTRISKTKADGTQDVIMRYRARNGFGGMSIGTVRGSFRNTDCSIVGWYSQDN